MQDKRKLKSIIRDKYAEIAVSNPGCGCGCDCGTEPELSIFSENYNNQPGYVKEADLMLGCGLPTEYAGIKPGNSVLDLGSGAGNDCFIARALVGESGEVTGLDFTEEMIHKAEANVRKLGYENVHFVKGDIEDMPLKDSSYDVVISNCVLNLVPDKKKAFAEIKRVLKDDGHFCVSDIVLRGELPGEILNASELYAGCISGALQMESYIQIIKDAGFNDVEMKVERQTYIQDEILLPYISKEELTKYRQSGAGISSITVVGKKQDS